MNRLPPIPDDDADPAVQRVYARFAQEGRAPIALYRALANAPALLEAHSELAVALRHQAHTPRGLRELVILRVATLTGSRYEWAHHVPMARAAGVSDAQMEEIRDWRASSEFDPRERAVLAATDEIHGCALTGEAFAGLREHFDDEQIAELIVLAAYYEAVARMIDGFGLAVEPEYGTRSPR